MSASAGVCFCFICCQNLQLTTEHWFCGIGLHLLTVAVWCHVNLVLCSHRFPQPSQSRGGWRRQRPTSLPFSMVPFEPTGKELHGPAAENKFAFNLRWLAKCSCPGIWEKTSRSWQKIAFKKLICFSIYLFFFFPWRDEVLLESFLWSSIGLGHVNSEGAWISSCCSYFTGTPEWLFAPRQG